MYFFFFEQKTAYEMRISDWSSDVCSSNLGVVLCRRTHHRGAADVDILDDVVARRPLRDRCGKGIEVDDNQVDAADAMRLHRPDMGRVVADGRSEEHTSELQSLMRTSYAVFCSKNTKSIRQQPPLCRP